MQARFNARLLLLPIALYLGTALGCKDAAVSDPDIPESLKVTRLVDMVDDFASEPDEVKLVPRLFAAGSEPSAKDLPRYSDYRYEGKPAVFNGDIATVVVMVKDAKTGKPAGEVTWSMKKLENVKASWNTRRIQQRGSRRPAGARRQGPLADYRCPVAGEVRCQVLGPMYWVVFAQWRAVV